MLCGEHLRLWPRVGPLWLLFLNTFSTFCLQIKYSSFVIFFVPTVQARSRYKILSHDRKMSSWLKKWKSPSFGSAFLCCVCLLTGCHENLKKDDNQILIIARTTVQKPCSHQKSNVERYTPLTQMWKHTKFIGMDQPYEPWLLPPRNCSALLRSKKLFSVTQ